jgi:hypothetical protein
MLDEYESFPIYELGSIDDDGLPSEIMRLVIISIPCYLAQY